MGEKGVDPEPEVRVRATRRPRSSADGQDRREPARSAAPPDERAGCHAYAVASQEKTARAYADGKIQPMLVPVATRTGDAGWTLATADEPPRPGTTMASLAGLKTPFRPHGRVTAWAMQPGSTTGRRLHCWAVEEVADELGLRKGMRLVSFAFAGVEPEVMGYGPVPSTRKLSPRRVCRFPISAYSRSTRRSPSKS